MTAETPRTNIRDAGIRLLQMQNHLVRAAIADPAAYRALELSHELRNELAKIKIEVDEE